jgi:hypothetical protein
MALSSIEPILSRREQCLTAALDAACDKYCERTGETRGDFMVAATVELVDQAAALQPELTIGLLDALAMTIRNMDTASLDALRVKANTHANELIAAIGGLKL